MKANQYQMIKYYISISKYLKWIKIARKRSKWQQKVKKLILIEGQLFHEKKRYQPTLVVQKHQIAAILYIVYDHSTRGHRGPESMSQKIRQAYYWEMIYEDCKRYIQTCRVCQFQSKSQKNNELYLIPIGKLQERIGIDLVGLLPIIKRENKYIVICIDYMMK